MAKTKGISIPAYFNVNCGDTDKPFVIMLTDASKIQHARNILSGTEKKKIHVLGQIVKEKVSYNPEWSFHLSPPSITFFEVAMEVCDATPTFIENNLAEVGDSTLPGLKWCPWCSKITSEKSI